MQKPGIKTVILASSLTLLLLVIFFSRSCGKSVGRIPVFDKIQKGDVRRTVSVTGELDIVNPVTVLSKISGTVDSIDVDFNQNVSTGQLLMKFDSTSIDQRIMKAESQLEGARFEMHSAQRDLDGKKNLFKDNLISKRAMEQAENEYNMTVNKYKQVKIDYDAAMNDRKFARILSPINGIVISIYKRKNELAAASTPLMLLAPNLSRMLLVINVDESDIGIIKAGQQVIFSVSAYPDKKFNGKISQVRINPMKNGSLVTYQSLVLCENDELLLKPGMTATATVIIEEKKNVLRAPNQAFAVSPGDESVNPSKKTLWKKSGITGGNSYSAVEVKTGLPGDMFTEITAGLKEGDEILVRIKDNK